MTINTITEATIAKHEATIARLVSLAEEIDDSTIKADLQKSIQNLSAAVEKMKKEMYGSLSAIQTAQMARHINRPSTLGLVKVLCEKDFVELHGDRLFGDDPAIVAGFGKIGRHKVMIIGHQKGSDVESNVYRNFGMPHPEGYRKALRAMKLAERFSLPIVTFIDTPGAFPGIGSEERGQSTAIASNLAEMSQLRVPIISIVTGEGGSGGALALGVADLVFMFKYSVYSVISPEGCASILWHDAKKAPEAAEALKIKAENMLEQGVIDGILDEPLAGINTDHEKAAEEIVKVIEHNLPILKSMTVNELISKRYEKFRRMGKFCRQEELCHAQKG